MNAPSRALLADRLLAPSLPRNVVLAVVGSIVLTLSAKVQVPMWPVPMTMQTYVVTVMAERLNFASTAIGVLRR